MLDFLSDIGISTYTRYESEGIMINNSNGDVVKLEKPKKKDTEIFESSWGEIIMNNIEILKKSDSTATITTLEIAEMMETEHWKILRKLEGQEKEGRHIKGYIEILNDNNIVVVDYFDKTSYIDAKGEERPCYNVTRLGCDFLANKFTGEKGVIFTARYVKRFAEMEKEISDPFAGLSTELRAVIVVDQRVTAVEKRVDRLEYDVPLYAAEADELCQAVKKKGTALLGGKKSNAYKDSRLRDAVYRNIYNAIKYQFDLRDSSGKYKSYKALQRKHFDKAMKMVKEYELPVFLREKVNDANSQINLEVA